MRSNACVLIRILPEVREEQKNPALAGPATPGTGPCGAHGASGNDGQKGHLTPLVSISELSSASGVAVAGLGVKLCGRSR